MTIANRSWRCTVCGYIHRGMKAPEACPVCGAPQELFEPRAESPPVVEPPIAVKWRCGACGYVHIGLQPPVKCPACGALADCFETASEAGEAIVPARTLRVVVIGAGIAGVSAIESLRNACPAAEITIVSKESELPYYRLNLTRYLAGEIGEQELPIHPLCWYEQHNICLRLGTEAAAVHLDNHAVELLGGERLPFDKLLLAAGAHPFVPPLPGADLAGATALRSVEDARHILEACRAGAKCVCIGGGLLGLETAGALARQGADVTLLEGYGWLLPRQLNQRAGELLNDYVTRTGIRLRTKAMTRGILGDRQVQGVMLEDGNFVPASLIVIATGVRPNSHLARQAGLEVNQGVVVDNYLATSHPDVFAAGDVAEHHGEVYGIWGPSQFQGSIAGMNMAGGRVEFDGIPRSNTLKVLGLDLFSIGQVNPQDASCRVFDEETAGSFIRLVVRDNRLVGAVLLRDVSQIAAVKNAVENRSDFSRLMASCPSASKIIAAIA